jgi:glycosyltransferase involved in cell wall biosynthesis
MTGEVPIAFLIPSYQPTEILCGLLAELRRASAFHIFIVDDGSGGDYAPVFQKAMQVSGTTLLTNAVNLGKGAALKHGMNHILVHHPDCVGVVTADGDGQHALADILSVADELRKNPGNLILGARRFDTAVPLRSRFGNAISRYVYRVVIGLNLGDTQTGLRGIPRRLMELCLGIRANRYEFETEQLVVVQSNRIPVQEIPIETIYINSNRDSHFRPLRDSARIYFALLRYSLASLVTEMTDLSVFASTMAWSDNLLLSNAIGRFVALWVQFTLLQTFVFRSRGSVRTLLMYIGLVVVSGVISTALQLQLAKIVPFPVVAKVMAEFLVFVFNFLFLRDFVFGRSSDDAARD